MTNEWTKVQDAITDRGWGQGHFESQNGQVCILGACGAAWHDDARWFEKSYYDGTDLERIELLSSLISVLPEYEHSSNDGLDLVVAYNDAEGRTVNEVLTLLDALAGR